MALALVIADISMVVEKTFTNSARWAILAIGAILAGSLIGANRCQAKNVKTWEDEAIKNHPKEKLKV